MVFGEQEAPKVATSAPGEVGYGGSAAQTYANISRSQWEDYITRFRPIENQLIGALSYDPETGLPNQKVIGENLSRAQGDVAASFDTAQGVSERNLSRLGIAPNAQQLGSIQKATAVARRAAEVDASNFTRARLADRDQELAMGTVPAVGVGKGVQ